MLVEGNLPEGNPVTLVKEVCFCQQKSCWCSGFCWHGSVCQSSLPLHTPAATAFATDYTGSRSCSSSTNIRPACIGVAIYARLSSPSDVAIHNKSAKTRSNISVLYVKRSAAQPELSHLRQLKSCLGGCWSKHELEQLKRPAVRPIEDEFLQA